MAERLKIVILSAFYEPQITGGAEKMVKEVVERLGKKHDITMVTGLFDPKVERVEQREDFKIIRVGIGHKQIDKILYPILAALKTKSLNPQIAHAIMESYAGGALVLVKYLAPKAKRILTLQSGDLDDKSKQNQTGIRFFWKTIHTSPDRITAISSFLVARVESLGFPTEKITITPNGLDFSEVDESISYVSGRVVNMGRLSWEKGQDYLLRAWPKVAKLVPDAKLYIYGEGKEEVKLREIMIKEEIGDSVYIKKMMPHPEFMRELKKAEVFVAPSLAEGLGNVFFEAQACGVPPIGTRVGGIPDIIEDGVNGLLIEPKNSEQIAEAIIKLLTDKKLRERLAQKGLETSAKFEWGIIMEKIEEVYSVVVSSK